MKITVLSGSPHKNGFTGILLEEFLALAPEGSEIQVFNSYMINARPCMGCGLCAKSDCCAFSDLDLCFDSIEDSDLIVIASPVYYLSFPSPLKAVIDRMQRFHEAEKRSGSRMKLRAKKCAVLLTAGAPSEKGEVIARQLRWITGPLGISEYKIAVCANTDRIPVNEFRETARSAASELMNCFY